MNSKKKLCWILFLGLSFGIVGGPVWSFEDSFNESDTPEGLEKELQWQIARGAAQSDNSAVLSHLASLYLDLGYGLYLDPDKKLSSFQEGARLAKKALQQDESSADAHFLYVANLGKAVQLQGLVAAALALETLKSHVNRVLELDEEHAPAHHVLGRIYEELPWFLGGDSKAAGEYLKKAISIDVRYAPGRLDLGKWYLKHGHSEEAAKEFITVIQTPPLEKRWIWERIHRPQAQKLLRQIRDSASPNFSK